jgi:SAM-dependent methyltransferase
MERKAEVLKHITKTQKGIEVGPWFSPLAPKQEGYNCLSLDVFDTEVLKERAKTDPLVADDKIPSIEPVDLIGTATAIDKIVEERGELETFDYIISSHNFEHSPNPIKFLKGCGRVLKPGGLLSMAIPDKRGCFDYFRPHTTMGQWVEAFFAERERPTLTQVFEQNSLHSRFKVGEEMRPGFSLADDPSNVRAVPTLREAYGAWASLETAKDTTYYDTHCSTFTPSSFRLLLTDAAFLGLSPFAVDEVSETNGIEFYVHLRNAGYRTYTEEQTTQLYAARQQLLHAIANECSYNSVASYETRKSLQELEQRVAQLQARINNVFLPLNWQAKLLDPLRRLKRGIRKVVHSD